MRNPEVAAGPGVAFHEEVVGDATELDAGVPEFGPDVRIVVDVTDEGDLHPNVRSRGTDSSHGLLGDRRGQFDRVRMVNHDRDRPAAVDDASKAVKQVVGVGIGDVPLWPVGHALGADADGLDVGEFRILDDPIDVTGEDLGPHDHGVASGEEHVGDLGMLPEVSRELRDVLVGELHVVQTDGLGPTEAERAVGVAGPARSGEEEGGLVVLVLDPRNRLAGDGRHVVGHLSCRMGIELELDLPHRGVELGLVSGIQELMDPIELLGREHVPMREGRTEEWDRRGPHSSRSVPP